MIPYLLARIIRLETRILNWDGLRTPDALLLHGNPIQVALVAAARADGLAQLLAGLEHAIVHALALSVESIVLLPAEELPGAVDGPVTEMAEASHSQGRRRGREHVLLEHFDALEVLRLGRLVLAALGRRRRRGSGLGHHAGQSRGCGAEEAGERHCRRGGEGEWCAAGEEPVE